MIRAALLAVLLTLATAAPGQEAKRELIYGAELMTRNEREAYRQNLERAKNEEEAQKVRTQHHERIQKRARARGATLDEAGLVVKNAGADKQKRERKGYGK